MANPLQRAFVGLHAGVYRLTGGRLGGKIGRSPVLLLGATGRKSGKRRTIPLVYLPHGDDYAIAASAGGSDRHPAWFRNLEANPDVQLQVGSRHFSARARVLPSDERAPVWASIKERYPNFVGYEKKTEREIPVVLLSESQSP